MTVEVPLGYNSYRIHIEESFNFENLKNILPHGTHVVIIGDTNTLPLFGDEVTRSLSALGYKTSAYSFSAGETSKTITSLSDIYSYLAKEKVDRKSCLLALGGGVTGDIVGLAAATWLRGIRYIQIPTTLLAQVDSSVGGKTAIDLPCGKNLVGAFWQPVAVFCNIAVLKSLPEKEFFSGLSEVIKYANILDSKFFDWLELHIDKILAQEPKSLSTMIAWCCTLKAKITAVDEKDKGLRAILNFGHTIGHAIESVSGYGTYTHGEAVAIGQIIAIQISEQIQKFSKKDSKRILALFQKAHLPVGISLHSSEKKELSQKILQAMQLDKKAECGIPKFVLLSQLGKAEHGYSVPEEIVIRCIENCIPQNQ